MTNRKPLNVLSLFDGMSCGQIALKNLGASINKYFASEIDKYAIKVANENFPNTIQLGDVCSIKGSELPKIDLMIGGFPCQNFSTAGNKKGFKGESGKLFYELLRIKEEIQPTYFMFENNVGMKKEIVDEISNLLGVQPIIYNSADVSPQNRKRLFWTNIPQDAMIKIPSLFQDIIEGEWQTEREKSHCLDACYGKNGNLKTYINKSRRQKVFIGGEYKKDLEVLKSFYKTSHTPEKREEMEKWFLVKNLMRPLTPQECEKLQTVPKGYTKSVSNSQRYRMLGNGWTVKVIEHVLKNIK